MPDSERLRTKLREYIDARRALTKAAKAEKKARAEKVAIEMEVHELLRELMGPGVKGSVPFDLGEGYGTVRFSPQSTHYGQVLDREMAEKALRDAGREREQIITTKLREQQLNELVREHLDHNQELPDGIGFYTRDYVQVTRVS